MPFDPKIAEARIALNMIGTPDLPRLAWDALEAGIDGPAIRRLAALDSPTFFEVEEVLQRAMTEMHMAKLTTGEAAHRLAKLRAQEILRSNDDPLKHVGDFEFMWIEADYPRELAGVGNLSDEVHVSRCCGQTDSDIRAWVLDRLRNIANS